MVLYDDALFDDSVFLSPEYFGFPGPLALLGESYVPFSGGEELANYRSSVPRRRRPDEMIAHPRCAVEGYSGVADFNIIHPGMTFLKEARKLLGVTDRKIEKRGYVFESGFAIQDELLLSDCNVGGFFAASHRREGS